MSSSSGTSFPFLSSMDTYEYYDNGSSSYGSSNYHNYNEYYHCDDFSDYDDNCYYDDPTIIESPPKKRIKRRTIQLVRRPI